jgi:CubicO group peptidase (beta-lactamase class C family)
LGSAGKFLVHIAALQCVDHGLITLDEPVDSHLPELKNLEVLSKTLSSDTASRQYELKPPTKKISLRDLLAQSSGIAREYNPLLRGWRASRGEEPKQSSQPINEDYSTPLVYEPGEGWIYGANIEWVAILVDRLTKQSMPKYVKENILDSLKMSSTVFQPEYHPDLSSRLLQMVRRDAKQLLPADNAVRGLISNGPDIASLMADLMGSSSKILKEESAQLLFEPAFAPSSSALSALRQDTENYAACAGIPLDAKEPPVNYSVVGLLVEDTLPLSHLPKGTATWNGMPNVIWAMNKERNLGMIFATQLVPVDDAKTMEIAMTFLRNAWQKFG